MELSGFGAAARPKAQAKRLQLTAYMLTCLHAYMLTYLHVYVLACLHAYMLERWHDSCLHACMLPKVETNLAKGQDETCQGANELSHHMKANDVRRTNCPCECM